MASLLQRKCAQKGDHATPLDGQTIFCNRYWVSLCSLLITLIDFPSSGFIYWFISPYVSSFNGNGNKNVCVSCVGIL